jgi:hypothetical protein
MIALLSFTTLAVVTLLALAVASAFHWLLLQIAFQLMRPATAKSLPTRTELVRGTSRLVRAFAPRR